MTIASITLKDFKGLNLQHSSELDDNELVDAQNVVVTNQGTLLKRPGCKHYGVAISGTTDQDRIILNYFNQSNGTSLLFTANQNKVRTYYKDAGPPPFYAAGPEVAMISSETAVQYDNKVFIFSTSVDPRYFTSTGANTGTFTTIASGTFPIRATHSLVHRFRIFYFDNTNAAESSRLRWTELASVSPFTGTAAYTANYIDISPGDGDFLVSVIELSGFLLVFKRYSTWILYTDAASSSWTARKVHDTVGCTGRDTPVLIENMVYFLAADGVYRTDGTTFEHISEDVDSAMIVPNGTLTPLATNRAAALRWKDWYLIRKDYNFDKLLFVYGWKTKTWTLWNLPAKVGPMVTAFQSTSATLYPSGVGGGGGSLSSAGLVDVLALDYEASSGYAHINEISQTYLADDVPNGTRTVWTSSGIQVQVETKFYDFGKPFDWKRLYYVMVDTDESGDNTSNRTMTITFNRGVATSSVSATLSDYRRAMWRFKGPGLVRYVSVKLNCTSAYNFELNAIGFAVAQDGDVGKSA